MWNEIKSNGIWQLGQDYPSITSISNIEVSHMRSISIFFLDIFHFFCLKVESMNPSNLNYSRLFLHEYKQNLNLHRKNKLIHDETA